MCSHAIVVERNIISTAASLLYPSFEAPRVVRVAILLRVFLPQESFSSSSLDTLPPSSWFSSRRQNALPVHEEASLRMNNRRCAAKKKCFAAGTRTLVDRELLRQKSYTNVCWYIFMCLRFFESRT